MKTSTEQALVKAIIALGFFLGGAVIAEASIKHRLRNEPALIQKCQNNSETQTYQAHPAKPVRFGFQSFLNYDHQHNANEYESDHLAAPIGVG